jgi:hypothetical protein
MRILLSFFILLGLIEDGRAVSSFIPFTEGFDLGSSNWLNVSSAAPTYSSTGGVANTGYIFTSGTVGASNFGSIVFRGNNSASASGGAFVGNWITAGVQNFQTYVWHNAPVALNFYVRFDKGSGWAADSNNFLVSPSTWTLLDIPIIDSLGGSGQAFQSYEGATGFLPIFSDIKNIQIALGSGQDASTIGQTYTIGVDNVSIMPEPTVGWLMGVGFGVLILGCRKQKAA